MTDSRIRRSSGVSRGSFTLRTLPLTPVEELCGVWVERIVSDPRRGYGVNASFSTAVSKYSVYDCTLSRCTRTRLR